MTFLEFVVVAVSCLVTQPSSAVCLTAETADAASPPMVETKTLVPEFTGESTDVVLTAQAALVWDLTSGSTLYEKNSTLKRPIASLNKLLSVLVVRDQLSTDSIVEVPEVVTKIQRAGAHISLVPGEHASVRALLAASLIASANDAMVALAYATASSEEAFVDSANRYAAMHGLRNTKLANATGLHGGEQYSTARDVREMLSAVYSDELLKELVTQEKGELVTQEGSRRRYTTTNKLLGSYLPIIAAKTGYTLQAGENLAIITQGQDGQYIGAIILGSDERFQDMKVLVEWIWRNYTWPQN